MHDPLGQDLQLEELPNEMDIVQRLAMSLGLPNINFNFLGLLFLSCFGFIDGLQHLLSFLVVFLVLFKLPLALGAQLSAEGRVTLSFFAIFHLYYFHFLIKLSPCSTHAQQAVVCSVDGCSTSTLPFSTQPKAV